MEKNKQNYTGVLSVTGVGVARIFLYVMLQTKGLLWQTINFYSKANVVGNQRQRIGSLKYADASMQDCRVAHFRL